MAEFVIDEKSAPLYEIKVPSSYTNEELAAFLKRAEPCLLAPRPYVLVVDATGDVSTSAYKRRITGEALARHRGHMARYCLGCAIAFDSPLVRGAMRAVWWLAPPAYPHAVFDSVPEARAWAVERLGRDGLAA